MRHKKLEEKINLLFKRLRGMNDFYSERFKELKKENEKLREKYQLILDYFNLEEEEYAELVDYEGGIKDEALDDNFLYYYAPKSNKPQKAVKKSKLVKKYGNKKS